MRLSSFVNKSEPGAQRSSGTQDRHPGKPEEGPADAALPLPVS